MPEDEGTGQKCIRVNVASHLLSILESPSRHITKIERLAPSEAVYVTVVHVVTGFLQLDESEGGIISGRGTGSRSEPDESCGDVEFLVNAASAQFAHLSGVAGNIAKCPLVAPLQCCPDGGREPRD